MHYHVDDTIAAIASPPGGAARGVIRLSGPQAVVNVEQHFEAVDTARATTRRPHARTGEFVVDVLGRDVPCRIPCRVLIWPTERSYTRQRAAEIHTLGSPPLLEAILGQLCDGSVRLARPGEFTLRSFLAGRIDLPQAEAVLGVIDADDPATLDAALSQLAGGLSKPLAEIRERLLSLLAELEAGLDFAEEEEIELIDRSELERAIVTATKTVEAALTQLAERGTPSTARRIVLAGPPNAGKSSLFNALLQHFQSDGNRGAPTAIVSPEAGTTRDYVEAQLTIGGVDVLLVDTAGQEYVNTARADSQQDLAQAAQHATAGELQRAALRIVCHEMDQPFEDVATSPRVLKVATKCDLYDQRGALQAGRNPHVVCSSVTGAGMVELAAEMESRIADLNDCEKSSRGGAFATRCRACLEAAAIALKGANEMLGTDAGDELIAAELRGALDALGDLLGATSADDVLDRIFSQFCIGK